HVVAWDEFVLSSAPKLAFPIPQAFLEKQEDGSFRIETEAYEARVTAEGLLGSLKFVGQRELLSSPLTVSMMRCPTENDGLKTLQANKGLPEYAVYHENKAFGPWLDHQLDSVSLELADIHLEEGQLCSEHRITNPAKELLGVFRQH